MLDSIARRNGSLVNTNRECDAFGGIFRVFKSDDILPPKLGVPEIEDLLIAAVLAPPGRR